MRTRFSTLSRFLPKPTEYQFMLMRQRVTLFNKTVPPLRMVVWDDPFGKEIPLDSTKRTSDQIAYINRLSHELSDGYDDLIKTACDMREHDSTPVIVTPEFSADIGLPLAEEQLQVMLDRLQSTLESIPTPSIRCHFASLFIHHTKPSAITANRMLESELGEGRPIVLNTAIIANKHNGKVRFNLFFKQIPDPQDVFYDMRHRPSNIEAIDFDSITQRLCSDNLKEHAVNEICLEHRHQLGLHAIGLTMAKMNTNESVDLDSYLGYHAVMSDSIEFIPENIAFKLAVHCDARRVPGVFWVSENHTDFEEVKLLKKLDLVSKSRIVNGAELTVFKPVVLQPLTSQARKTIMEWKEILKTEGATSEDTVPSSGNGERPS